jgi:hypothetical protein
MVASQLVPALVLPLVAWRIYSRYRKLVGLQRPSTGRQWLSIILFPLVLALMLWGASQGAGFEMALAATLAGAVVGLGLAHWGLKLTHYGRDDTGLFYQPNRYMGMALMALFLGRLAYRFLQVAMAGGNAQAWGSGQHDSFQPSTMLVIGIIFAYYPYYSAGILRWTKAQDKQAPTDLA